MTVVQNSAGNGCRAWTALAHIGRVRRPDQLTRRPRPSSRGELARHDGVATVRALGLLGLGRGQIDRLVATGWWERAGRGVVRDRAAPRTWRQELWAALLAVGPVAVASHESAAAIHGIGGCVEGPVVLSVPRAARGMRPGMVVHGVGRLAPPDVIRARRDARHERVPHDHRSRRDRHATRPTRRRHRRRVAPRPVVARLPPTSPRRARPARSRRGAAARRADAGLGWSQPPRTSLPAARPLDGLPAAPSGQVVHRRGSRTVDGRGGLRVDAMAHRGRVNAARSS